MIKCEINGQNLEVPQGTSIIEAFKKLELDIAHYCWHPGLSVAGVCRLCMVDIEGIPKLQIACNTEVKEGMKISNRSQKVRQAVHWGLEFHLINHPLDCPICDQAGECELQEQYMRFGQYSPHMAEHKVKKRKVIDLGPKIVLDSERCILCSRCVRFTDEVSQTGELGIFHRGDRSEIGIFKDKPLNNNYALNTVDICPVGALTSKDFRFRQRVWYLKTSPSLCPGCSTGCHIFVDHNEEGLFRVRPRYNQEINGHWMCDKGRGMYALSNRKGRLTEVLPPADFMTEGYDNHLKKEPKPWTKLRSEGNFLGGGTKPLTFDPVKKAKTISVLKKIRSLFIEGPGAGSPVAVEKKKHKHDLVLTAQYSNEEYGDIISFFLDHLGTKEDIYYWQNNMDSFSDFDGLLLRGDKNPNTKGLLQVLDRFGVPSIVSPSPSPDKGTKSQSKEQGTVESPALRAKNRAPSSVPCDSQVLWVAGPENQKAYPDIEQKLKQFEAHYDHIVWWTTQTLPVSSLKKTWQIPTKAFFEKEGTFVNFQGREQKTHPLGCFVSSALCLSESAQVLSGRELESLEPAFLTGKLPVSSVAEEMKSNHLTLKKRAL